MVYSRPNGQPSYEKEVKNIFKLFTGKGDQYAITVEQGVHKETIAVSFDRSKYRAKGFIKTKESIFNSHSNDVKEVINMHNVFTSLVNLLNNLHSADLLIEVQYNTVIDAYEPFIFEALDFSEIEPFLEKDSGLNIKKKKRISRRGRS